MMKRARTMMIFSANWVQTFTYTFTTPNYSTSTPIVIRFYRLNQQDSVVDNGGLSLIIPGNHAAQYYDTTGRRVVNEIVL
jgi:hypothetical protein